MATYLEIVGEIPAPTLSAAMTELAISRPLLRSDRDANGVVTLIPIQDDLNNQLFADGKFMVDTTILTAFDLIKDMKNAATSKGEHKQTYISLSADIGVVLVAQLEICVGLAIVAGDLSSWIESALNDKGINVNDPQVVAVLTSLVGSHGFTTELVDAIVGTGSEQLLKFPGLKPGHVQTALQKRYRGEI